MSSAFCFNLDQPKTLSFGNGLTILFYRLICSFIAGHHYRVTVHVGGDKTGTVGQIVVQLDGTWGASEWLTVTR